VHTASRTQLGVGLREFGRRRAASESGAVVELEKPGPRLLDQEIGAGEPGELFGHQRAIRVQQRKLMGKAE
jgi:hypothetical protein